MFVEENTERVQREKDAQIMVVIGNPPYNVGQRNENDNNKNRKYPVVDEHVQQTYAKDSRASNKNALSDVYVKFFRWAIDRLQGRDGIVCFVSNNSFVDQIAFDGMRKHLLQDFTQIYHLDLHGNVRKNPKLSGTTHNVFGIKLGVGITIAIRSSRHAERKLFYYRVPEFWRKTEKLAFLARTVNIDSIGWQELQPDEKYTWLTEGMRSEFESFLPMGTREAKFANHLELEGIETGTLFKLYSPGIQTSRDSWMYDFNASRLANKASNMIETYNAELSRWIRAGCPKDIDSFVQADETKIKWSSRLKECLIRKIAAQYTPTSIRHALFRPFTHQFVYFDNVMTHRQCLFPSIFPDFESEAENIVICLTNLGSEKPFMVLPCNIIPDMHLVGAGAGTQCFPYYIYEDNGSNRRENITDWALKHFQEKYSTDVTKWDIFHYVYAMLHHPQYREGYTENLKRSLPHIPLLQSKEAFLASVSIGKQLIDSHLHYEQAKEYQLKWIENKDVPFSWRVERMQLASDRTAVVVNESLTLAGIPQECFQYRLGNRSALEWVIDQYQVSEDKRSRIRSDPNNLYDEEYIVRLVGKVVTVSVETVRLVNELAQAVKIEDWVDELNEEN